VNLTGYRWVNLAAERVEGVVGCVVFSAGDGQTNLNGNFGAKVTLLKKCSRFSIGIGN